MSPHIVIGDGTVTYGPVAFRFRGPMSPEHAENAKRMCRERVALAESLPDDSVLKTLDGTATVGEFREWFGSRQDG